MSCNCAEIRSDLARALRTGAFVDAAAVATRGVAELATHAARTLRLMPKRKPTLPDKP